MTGARAGAATWFHRLVAPAIAADLTAFVVPGIEIARAYGLDLGAAGLRVVPTPRHATVLVLLGELPDGLKRAAAITYAQMPRPRAILALGVAAVPPLPMPDVVAALEQPALARGVTDLRRLITGAAFSPAPPTFEAAAVQTRTTYTCPMHPEIVRDAPGSCPICGMDLVPREDVGTGMGHGAVAMAHSTMAMLEEPGRDATLPFICPMHPEITRKQAGKCPLCGMNLVPREGTSAAEHGATAMARDPVHRETGPTYTCPMHPEIVRDTPGSCPICGMDLILTAHADGGHTATKLAHTAHQQHDAAIVGASPDDHEAVAGLDRAVVVPQPQAELGCGERGHDEDGPRKQGPEHEGHGVSGNPPPTSPDAADNEMQPPDHGIHEMHADHGERMVLGRELRQVHTSGSDMGSLDHSAHTQGGFMSMVAMTRDLPRSRDGLPMEWTDVPFGPLFPGLPGGLDLALTLDGDMVTRAALTPGATGRGLAATWAGPAATLPNRLARLDPLTPFSYRLLARRALDSAAGIAVDDEATRARIYSLERERAAGHLGWLASFGHLLGVGWLAARAAALQLALLDLSDPEQLPRLDAAIRRLVNGVERTPLLARRLVGIGRLAAPDAARWRGPVARASGLARDARADDPAYLKLGFMPVTLAGADALARLRVRLAELTQSLDLIAAVGASGGAPFAPWRGDYPAGPGLAVVETPRGAAILRLTLEGDTVREVQLETPSAAHADLLATVSEGHELADALIGIVSLDLSPWEIEQ